MADEYQQIVEDLAPEAPAAPPDIAAPLLPPETVPAGYPRPPHDADFRVVYFDLEIRNSIESCGGWEGAISQGGVSALCLWDSIDENAVFYDDHCLDTAALHLEDADVVVSFNGKAFDVPLIERHLRRTLHLKEHIDVFELAKKGLERYGKPWKGNGLDALSSKTVHRGKNGVGSHAPQLVAEGHWAELFTYCLRDVVLTRDLLTFARRNGYIFDKDGQVLPLDVPSWLQLRPGVTPK